MYIKKVKIKNFKGFKDDFELYLNENLNILVGNNESGKSTVLEAIHLTLTGLLNGRYLKNELSSYLFNHNVVAEYVKNVQSNKQALLPEIVIELYLDKRESTSDKDDKAYASLMGRINSERDGKARGIKLVIAFDEAYKKDYETYISRISPQTIPIEYYDCTWYGFDGNLIKVINIPFKSVFIDSSSGRLQNSSDVYISRIVKDFLDTKEVIDITQAHREMKEDFNNKESVRNINFKIQKATEISRKNVKLSVDFSSKNIWENSLTTYLDETPFHFIGKGEQCIIKTKLALQHKKTQNAGIILLEEPENHLSFSKLNELVSDITKENSKQILVSTHSSFVANKLGLENIILLNDRKTFNLSQLSLDTYQYFEKLPGYETLRLLLCQKAILVEGPSDELIMQRAYMDMNEGKLPIEDGIDVISVGSLAFTRFLSIAENIGSKVVVVTDNDGDVNALCKKYVNYMGKNTKANIKISYSKVVDKLNYNLTFDKKEFNINTLEPQIVKANNNDLALFGKLFSKDFSDINNLYKLMYYHKTDCALKIFESDLSIKYPEYIIEALTF